MNDAKAERRPLALEGLLGDTLLSTKDTEEADPGE
jgi:hypothetical protein